MSARNLALSSSDPFAPLAAVLVAMLSITAGASLAKSLFPLIGPAGTTALRLFLAAVMLSVAFRVWRIRTDRKALMAAVPYGMALGAMNLLFYMSIQRIPLGIALAIEFIGPLAVAVLSSRRRADLGWIVLAIAGLALLLPLRTTTGAVDPLGAGLALAAGVFWAAYILAGKRAGDALGASATALGMIVASVVVMPFGVAEAGAALLDPQILVIGLGVAFLSSAIPCSLEMFALRRLPAKSFGILTSGEPAVGAVMGMLLLGEALPLAMWLGIAAIVAASIGTTLSVRGAKDALGQEGDAGRLPRLGD